MRVSALVAALCLVAGISLAQDATDIVFSQVEKRFIGEYFGHSQGQNVGPAGRRGGGPSGGGDNARGGGAGGSSGQMPPGLARRDELPPGLERQYAIRGTLPPGLDGRALPNDLISRLPSPRPGTRRMIVGSDVVLTQIATGVILDIIFDAVTD